MVKFTRMRSKLGRRKFIVIESFTWCERKYLEWFRGFTYFEGTMAYSATLLSYDGMKVRYVDKHKILFKPGKRILDLKEEI